MLTSAIVFAAFAALVHIYIFWLESLAFGTTGRRVFGVSEADARVAAPWAYNQGFYNLFLAIGTAIGVMLTIGGHHDAGIALVAFGCGSMLAAAAVLLFSDRTKARGAIVQGTMPAIALVLLLIRVATG